MKIRTSFISNSSSSSYIITTTEKNHKIILNKLRTNYPEITDFWENKVKISSKKLGSENIISIYVFLSTEDKVCIIGDYIKYCDKQEDYDDIEYKFNEYFKLIEKSKTIILNPD